jgi:hypothetical protein
MNKNALRTIALSLALATGGAGVLQAAHAQAAGDNTTQAEQKPAPERHRGPMGHHGAKGHHFFRGGMEQSPLAMLGHLKSRLNLTDSQQKLWDAAQSASREAGQAMRAQREEGIKALRTQVAAGPLDLRALSARHDAERAAVKPKLDAARDAWLAAYDSLDGKQKQVVTDAVKQRLERGDRMREHRRQDAPSKS